MKIKQNVISTPEINIAMLDLNGNIVSYNKQWDKFAKDNNNSSLKNSDIGSNYLEVTKKAMIEGDEYAKQAFDGIMDLIKGQLDDFAMEYPCNSPNEERWFILHAVRFTAINCKNNDLIMVYHENITDLKKYEDNLKSSQQKYKSLTESTHAILWIYDVFEEQLTYISPQAKEFFGYPLIEWNDRKFWQNHVHPDDLDRVKQYFKECIEYRESRLIDYRFYKKNGTLVWIRNVFDVDFKSMESNKIQGFMFDITASKILEEMKKKEILLTEVYHRVKNNLQVIESLLNMQAREIDDESIRANFTDSRNRVKSMLIAHNILYESGGIDNIEISDYIKKLSTSVFEAHNVNEAIKLNIKSDSVNLDMDTLLPLALIINEIITNSIKYAFSSRNEGSININFKKVEDEKYLLKIADDGVGIPDNFDVETSKSLGLKLINMLVQQLQGTLDINNSNGTSYVIRF